MKPSKSRRRTRAEIKPKDSTQIWQEMIEFSLVYAELIEKALAALIEAREREQKSGQKTWLQ